MNVDGSEASVEDVWRGVVMENEWAREPHSP